jgi:hypothetical protein
VESDDSELEEMDLLERGDGEDELDEGFAEIAPREAHRRSEERLHTESSAPGARDIHRDRGAALGSIFKKPKPFATTAASQRAALANVHASQFSSTRRSSR